jgi:hypothetical protein
MRWLLLALLVGCVAPVIEDDGDGDGDGFLDEDDCDPWNADAYPGADDPYGDDRDQDCDGGDGVDVDNDGYPANVRSNPAWFLLWDCDDSDAAINPLAADLVGDGADTNCDELDGVDSDRDGYASIASGGDDCDDEEEAISPAEADIVGDDRDRDCDGIDGEDADRDGWASSDSGGTDCDDTDPGVFPGAFDGCDGIHADCMVSPDELDQDGDGFMPCEGDCADSDAARFPGAPESCDSGDLNCDGVAGSTDADGDGVTGCAGDCDDSDATVYPGAPEGCDGLDGDCSGAPDPSEADGDGDGVFGCLGDCDDGDAAIHPGAWDEAGGADADCDGSADTASMGWASLVGADADAFGALMVGGDFDGDGLWDVAIAAPGSNAAGSFSDGRIYVYPGSLLAGGGELIATSAPRILEGEAPLDFAGSALVAGDFDGDGLDDLAVGAFGQGSAGQNAGRVYVVDSSQLRSSGVSDLSAVSAVYDGVGLDAQAGESLAAGDIDGDGIDDLVVGSSGVTTSGPWTGAAYILFGGAMSGGSLGSAPLVLSGGSEGAFAGASVGAGDVDGDGLADVLVGAPGLDAAYLHFSGSLPGSGTVSVTSADRTFPGGGPTAAFGDGASLLDDVDGDGRAEVALWRTGSAPAIEVWRSATLPATATVTSAADWDFPNVTTLVSGSDGDSDGRADLVLGWASTGQGAVVYSSSMAPAGAVLPAYVDLLVSGAGLGAGAPGDVTGDGRGDYLVAGGGAAGLWPAP